MGYEQITQSCADEEFFFPLSASIGVVCGPFRIRLRLVALRSFAAKSPCLYSTDYQPLAPFTPPNPPSRVRIAPVLVGGEGSVAFALAFPHQGGYTAFL
jgi:hypothetical protein